MWFTETGRLGYVAEMVSMLFWELCLKVVKICRSSNSSSSLGIFPVYKLKHKTSFQFARFIAY